VEVTGGIFLPRCAQESGLTVADAETDAAIRRVAAMKVLFIGENSVLLILV